LDISSDPPFTVRVARASEFTFPSRQLVIENATGDMIEVVQILDTETVRIPGCSEQCDPGDLDDPLSGMSEVCAKAFREGYDWMGSVWVNSAFQFLLVAVLLIAGCAIAQAWINVFRHQRVSAKELDPKLGIKL